jgi:diguanylate cyclase (GGDEF)-like protein
VAWEETLSVEQARRERHPRPLVLLALDLDGLKGTNDTHGHAAGDELIVSAAGIMRESLRAGDVVARVGGDEFGAILPDADPAAAEAVCAKIAAACGAWRGSVPEMRLRVSMGWAAPEPGETLSATFGRADAAMYEAKRGAA